MQDILHVATIAIPVIFAALMVLDLISNLKQLWIACKPSTPVSIPASILQPQPEVAAPAIEPEELKIMPDPWELEASAQPVVTTPRLTVVLSNLLLLPPAKSRVEVQEVAVPVAASVNRKVGRPKKEVASTPVAAPKRRGRPRKIA